MNTETQLVVARPQSDDLIGVLDDLQISKPECAPVTVPVSKKDTTTAIAKDRKKQSRKRKNKMQKKRKYEGNGTFFGSRRRFLAKRSKREKVMTRHETDDDVSISDQ
jgi:hypothetical protein